jgi:alkaline phosphatase D
MNEPISRRAGIKLITAGTLMGLGSRSGFAAENSPTSDIWSKTHDRVFLGGNFWANPMEDWKVSEGGAECISTGPSRSVHSLTHQLTKNGAFEMSVTLQRIGNPGKDTGAGFRIGMKSELNEHKSNCFVTWGLIAGWRGSELVLGREKTALRVAGNGKKLRLVLKSVPQGDNCQLSLIAFSAESNDELGSIKATVPFPEILGNVSIASNLAAGNSKGGNSGKGGVRYRFSNWTLGGDAFTVTPENRFGPILWSMYSLSDSRSDEGFVMKISALTGPMGPKDNQNVELHIKKDGAWKLLGEAKLDPDAWVATFRIPNWDEKEATPYKLVYREKHRDGSETPDEWTGTIRANPEGRPLRMAAMTCQNDIGFPYEPVTENIRKLDADLLFFSGDQIYEAHGGFGIIRNPADRAILNYLRKFYQFGWCFRDSMRNSPTLCLPDDHDVFQGNIWGEGGAPMGAGENDGASSKGGYIEPARMVNAVHKTNCAHHPDAYDPSPAKQDISVYYGDMVYGGVGFAILADRQWKSGPEHVDTGKGRADHVPDPDFDTASLDKPGLVLLGERQEEFLKKWAEDWRGHRLKAVLSQTVFSGMATHHGGYDGYLKADLDSSGWPQTPRNRAIDIMRPSMALHINGDQHLTTLTQYGVKAQRDSNWSFCTPAISVGYPRWWRPDEVGMPHQNRPKHGREFTGEYLDGLGNKAYVYAVGNPIASMSKHRYQRAHEKGSGFGFVTFDTEKKTYYLESFRFNVDATDGKPENQFPGWPVTIHQKENRGENVLE